MRVSERASELYPTSKICTGSGGVANILLDAIDDMATRHSARARGAISQAQRQFRECFHKTKLTSASVNRSLVFRPEQAAEALDNHSQYCDRRCECQIRRMTVLQTSILSFTEMHPSYGVTLLESPSRVDAITETILLNSYNHMVRGIN